MSDEYGQVRPSHPTYEADIDEIRSRLRSGSVVYFEHAENMTAHRMLMVPGAAVEHFTPPWGTKKYSGNTVAFYYEDHRGPLFAHLDGSDWVHYTYTAEKFGIEKYPGDAISLANLINRILGWGEDEMQTEAGR